MTTRRIPPALWLAASLAMLLLGAWLGARFEHLLGPAVPAPAAHSASSHTAAQPEAPRKILYYRNPMGLPDTSPVPKKDPMGMDYLPVYEGETPAGKLVKVAPERMQVLGVTTAEVAARVLVRRVRAVGTVSVDERGLFTVAPRFEGWIEKLHVNETGKAVAAGQPLFEVYSPELVSAQEEYLLARAADGLVGPERRGRLAEAAGRRLANWGLAEADLAGLRREGQVRRTLPYRTPAGGVVLEKMAVEGMRFMPGEPLFRLADLATVWLIADIYEQDLAFVHPGQAATIRIDAFPGEDFAGRVSFVYPELKAETRTARVRFELDNPGGRLQPGQFARVELAAGHGGEPAVAVPEAAVLDSGQRQIVLVAFGEGLFEPREVRLGLLADGYYAVRTGLAEGERVVTRANFLIDAESNLKAALGSFGHAGHGGSPAGKQEPADKPEPAPVHAGHAPAAEPEPAPPESASGGPGGHGGH
ncbi:MAG: efflux RND transporter periplasmic adaptor subunit [Gammaproteobacteria bacterium]|nr:efflux RND transporter periplasmic adaptor subunit [Gammaproteobacteria bacterium]